LYLKLIGINRVSNFGVQHVLLMISCLRGVAQLIHTRAEEGGLGTADGKQKKKMKKSNNSVQRAMQIAENASRNHAHMILDMRRQ
jgi:hypothetical protein